MIEGMNPMLPQRELDNGPVETQQKHAKLKEATQQFEQMFLKQMFAQMRKSIPKNSLTGEESKEKETFDDMLDDERSKSWTQSGGIGLADMMYRQALEQEGTTPA